MIKNDHIKGEPILQVIITIYSLFSGYDKGELTILGKSTFSRGFRDFFVNISTRALARV